MENAICLGVRSAQTCWDSDLTRSLAESPSSNAASLSSLAASSSEDSCSELLLEPEHFRTLN